MTATSLQFGPEWMRTKQQTTPSTTRPPNSLLSPAAQNPPQPAPPGASSYSSLLTSPVPPPPEKQESVNPFMYSKDEMLQVWKDGGGRGGLGLEVELWEGVVKEIGSEPIGLREISEAERKLFSLPLNSDLRRRQSHDFLPTPTLAIGDRPKLPHSGSSTHSPLTQQRYGALGGRRRKDEDGGQPLTAPRRLSLSSVASPLGGPLSPTAGALPSPRARLGSGTHGMEPVPNSSDGSWRKRDADMARPGGQMGGGHGLDERDEESEGDGKKQSSGLDPNDSFRDPDVSLSASDRSMAPSPPSVRGDPQYGRTEDLTVKLGGVALTDDHRTFGGISGTLGTMVDGNNASKTERPPGIEEDPASVSWSYRDPKGNIQGPFAATLMQKWYDEGYFTPDLLMKRTHVDTDWTPVGELSLRAGNDKLFFSSFADNGPPGLAPRPAAPVDAQTFERFGLSIGHNVSLQSQHPTTELSANGSPLHPFRGPVAARTPILDSYRGDPSESPASPFGAAIGPMPSVSPDPSFGIGSGRSAFGNNGVEATFAGRTGPFDSQTSSLSTRGIPTAFNTTTDSPYGPRLPSLNNRGGMFDNQGFTNMTHQASSASPWTAGVSGSAPRNLDPPALNSLSAHRPSLNNGVFGQSPVVTVPGMGSSDSPMLFGSEAYNYPTTGFGQLSRGPPSSEALSSNFGPIGPGVGLREQGLRPHLDMDSIVMNNRHGLDEGPRSPSNFINGYGQMSPAVHSQGPGFVNQTNQHSGQHLPPMSTFGQSPVPTSPLAALQSQQQPMTNLPIGPPWGVPETAQSRAHPFDPPHPSARNAGGAPITPIDAPSNNKQQSSDWTDATRPDHEDGWGDVSGTQAPAVNQTKDANQGQQLSWNAPPRTSPAPFDRAAEQTPRSIPTPPAPQLAQPQAREPTPQVAAPKKRASGSVAQAAPLPISKPAPLSSSPKPPSPLPPASTHAKPAWSTPVTGTDDEAKPAKQTGLREIQEAEAKRVEAKKIAERERERATRAQPQEETQTYTASWGLPTSQVGTARSTPKEPSVTSPSATPTPVWTNAGKPPQAKRTMKEIQEEEERRKKAAAKDKETAAAAARRAYAESANKTPSGPPAGGVWTTVGSGGKTTPSIAAARQASGSAPSTLPSPAMVRSPTTPVVRAPSASPQNVKLSASKPAPADDGPVPPSPEFMKWLREAVRGFNPGFNTEEFMAMLLAFSLDFPPSTVEVIQDMVYMNSATLDGRRFAADFCSKRKADAANRPKGWGASTSGKTPSLADVVKTQPKPAQAEFGFKMVKKKGRGNALR